MFVARPNEIFQKQGGGAKSPAGELAEYVEDDFVPTTRLWTIAADRSRIEILQLALYRKRGQDGRNTIY